MDVCMMRVWKMHISVICELDACIYDAGFFCYQRTNQPTEKAILGVGWVSVWMNGWCPLDRFDNLKKKNQHFGNRNISIVLTLIVFIDFESLSDEEVRKKDDKSTKEKKGSESLPNPPGKKPATKSQHLLVA